MERGGNYFMPNNGQIGFSPLHMLGLSAIHPKSMQQGFVDVSVNTHTVDNNFSLFKCKDPGSEVVNMKNNFINPFGCRLPVGNSFSKLIGGFIGSKCLIGSSTDRENNFWGRVLEQYNNIIGTNNNLYISMSAMNSKESTKEYIKAGAVDAAFLLSQSFHLMNTNNFIYQEQTMDTTKHMSPEDSPTSPVEKQIQEKVTAEPKQSYAEVAKSQVASKIPGTGDLDRCSTGSKILRSARRDPVKLRQKKQSLSILPNNNWRYRDHHNDFGKYRDRADYSREHHRKHCTLSRDNQHKSITVTDSTNGTGTPHTPQNQKMNHLKTRRAQHTASNSKFSGKRRLNSDLLSDIKEDCLDLDSDLMACEKKGSFNLKLRCSPNKKMTPPTYQGSPSDQCANWRCRPYSLCDPCKMKDSYGNDVPDCYGSHTQRETVTFETEQKENDKENSVPERPVTSLTEEKSDNASAKPVACSDSSLTEYEIFVSTRCPMLRTRISSECSIDSEDSFVIMFDAGGDDSCEETSSETASVCSDSDSSESEDDEVSSINSQCLTSEEHIDRNDDDDDYCYDDDDDDDDDEIDFNDDAEIEGLICVSKTELKEANERWKSAYEDIPSAEKESDKVQFAKTPELKTVHKIIAWDFAYRAARVGPWELIARDRIRFHRRIEHMSRILSPVLQNQHRRNIWEKFHKDTLDVP
ncbi:uncharacterized protein LOC124544594 isoform X1 [Schistocerca americana]|uniref:uncharacterized protein LOC124544594 isoform X1 n=1 Tax=Schistocerca americana TaxID=7009 RepID=UPI001F4FF20D|nr:uncharacterized protein LOC124544594 isoform X1 [Schistocerca americana]